MLPPSFLGYKDLVVVTLGTGVGGGIIVNGKMLTGANGAGGEIGHIHVEDDEQEACGCGNRGCLEQYSSATGVTRLAKRKLEKTTQDSVLRTSTLSAKSVFDAVKAKDPVAMEIAEQFGQYLGEGLAAIACVTNPEAFVIGGGVSKAGSVLIDYIRPPFHISPRAATLASLPAITGSFKIFSRVSLILNTPHPRFAAL